MLTDDGDPEVRGAAEATLAAIPTDSLAAFLGRPDVSDGLRDFFRGRGIEPIAGGETTDDPLVDGREARRQGGGREAISRSEEGDGQRGASKHHGTAGPSRRGRPDESGDERDPRKNAPF